MSGCNLRHKKSVSCLICWVEGGGWRGRGYVPNDQEQVREEEELQPLYHHSTNDGACVKAERNTLLLKATAMTLQRI